MKITIIKSIIFTLVASSIAFAKENPVTEKMNEMLEDNYFSGAVTAVLTKDKIIDFQTFGVRNVETNEPMEKDLIFFIASQTKPISAVAFMTFVDEGKIKLDDPVSKYLPEYADIKVKKEDGTFEELSRPLLISDVVCHMGGFAQRYDKENIEGRNVAERVDFWATQYLVDQPGTKYTYCNASWNIASRIMEIVSGKDYVSIMKERVFIPLEMPSTRFDDLTEDQIKKIPEAYKLKDGGFEHFGSSLYRPHWKPNPTGSLCSTVDDLANFCSMILNKGVYKGKRILSEESVKIMGEKITPKDLPGYGVGFQTEGNSYGHSGAGGTQMWFYPDEGIATILMIQVVGDPKEVNITRKSFREAALKLNK